MFKIALTSANLQNINWKDCLWWSQWPVGKWNHCCGWWCKNAPLRRLEGLTNNWSDKSSLWTTTLSLNKCQLVTLQFIAMFKYLDDLMDYFQAHLCHIAEEVNKLTLQLVSHRRNITTSSAKGKKPHQVQVKKSVAHRVYGGTCEIRHA